MRVREGAMKFPSDWTARKGAEKNLVLNPAHSK